MGDNFPRKIKRYSTHLPRTLWYHLRKPPLAPTRFIIFGRGRSGSTTLVSLLDSVPDLQCDGEILGRYVPFPHTHLLTCCARSKAAVYGCKLLSYQVRDLQPLANRPKFITQLAQQGFKIIYLRRENLILHALSNIRARNYGFHKTRGDQSVSTKITLDPDEMLQWMQKSEALQAFESTALQDIPHLSLTYEQHLSQETAHQTTVDLICAHLGIASAPVQSQFRKVSPKTFHDSVENAEQISKFLAQTPYAHFLNNLQS